MLHYFAYGSNLHPVRLVERIPSARLIGNARLERHRLQFRQRGGDASGKCNIVETGDASDIVHGAVYALDPDHKPILDRFEGAGYADRPVTLHCDGKPYDCFTYLSQPTHIVDHLSPFDWYKQLVLLGARYLDFPEAYIDAIESHPAMPDPDATRRERHESLIGRMEAFAS